MRRAIRAAAALLRGISFTLQTLGPSCFHLTVLLILWLIGIAVATTAASTRTIVALLTPPRTDAAPTVLQALADLPSCLLDPAMRSATLALANAPTADGASWWQRVAAHPQTRHAAHGAAAKSATAAITWALGL